MIMSPCCAVRALKSLQNAMMLTPCWPSAGPTGGEGLALPAGSCNFTYPVIFFIARYLSVLTRAASSESRPSPLLDRREIELDARRTPEDRHLHLQLLLVHLHVVHRPREVGEGSVEDPNLLAHLEGLARLRLDDALLDPATQVVDLGDRHLLRGLVADEAGDLRGVLDEVPDDLAHLHLDEDVPGQAELLTHARLAAGPVLRDGLAGDEDLAELVLQRVLLGTLLERIAHLGLVPGVGVNHVPLLRHVAP